MRRLVVTAEEDEGGLTYCVHTTNGQPPTPKMLELAANMVHALGHGPLPDPPDGVVKPYVLVV